MYFLVKIHMGQDFYFFSKREWFSPLVLSLW
jgi:hypothetical protein